MAHTPGVPHAFTHSCARACGFQASAGRWRWPPPGRFETSSRSRSRSEKNELLFGAVLHQGLPRQAQDKQHSARVGKVDLKNDEVFSQDIARLLGELRATRWLRDGTVHRNKNTVHLFFAFDFPFVCLLANLVVNLEDGFS